MQYNEPGKWLNRKEERRKILAAMQMPLTAKQMAKRTGIAIGACSGTLIKFARKGIAVCLNPSAVCSRIYGLTDVGISCQKQLCRDLGIACEEFGTHSRNVSWDLLGWVFFSHRSMVIRAMNKPMYPSEIRRRIRGRFPGARLSVNNICDVIRLCLAKGIVRPVRVRKKARPQYELTELGTRLLQMLIQVEQLAANTIKYSAF